MRNEYTIIETKTLNDEKTVVDNHIQNKKEEAIDETPASTRKGSNKSGRAAAFAAGVAAAASTAAAGAFFINQNEDMVEAEPQTEPESAAEPETEDGNTSDYVHDGVLSEQSSASEEAVVPGAAVEMEAAVEPEVTFESEASPEYEPQAVVDVYPEVDVPEAEPEVEILGVEVVETEDGDMTVGGMTVNGEEYVLVDVDGGNFDVAWHDDNCDMQMQESELIDISDANISVEDFEQAAGCADNVNDASFDNMIADNGMDPMDPGEIDYMDTSDTSGLV